MQLQRLSLPPPILFLLLALPGRCSSGGGGGGCWDEQMSLAQRRDAADLILTGIATSVVGDRAQVGVIQVLKDSLSVLDNSPQTTRQSLDISGFGNPVICKSEIEVNLVKIIMVSVGSAAHQSLRLNSSLVDVSLDSLDIIRHNPDPCDRVKCGYGEVCSINEQGSTSCNCISCSDPVDQTPVCGTDDQQYASECYFKRAVCLHNLEASIAKYGPCKDPCEGLRCEMGSVCVPASDYRTATCQCEDTCPADYEPICTETGREFRNQCELNREMCFTREEIQIKFFGACDPCERFTCPEHTVCRIDTSSRQPICSCGQQCLSGVQPVCGTDGKEYINECELQKQACILNKNIDVVHQGPCSELLDDPCDMVTCSRHQECVRSANYGACSCMFRCPDVYKPVCGKYQSDDTLQDFPSECDMKLSACRQQRDIHLFSRGRCQDIDESYHSRCDHHPCPLGRACTLNAQNEPFCDCAASCDDSAYQPVCGSNFKTYRNLCELERSNCLQGTEVSLLHEEACPDPCSSTVCDNYAMCRSRGGNVATCECPSSEDCDASDSRKEAVCGSDGVTYQDVCEMKKTSCNTNTKLTVSYYGYCFKDDACLDVTCNKYATCRDGECMCESCEDAPTSPVCATNNESFDSECKMRRYACLKSVDISIFHTGVCINDNLDDQYDLDQKLLWACSEKCIGGSCVKQDDIWQCTCPSCDDDPPVNALCGENGVTYSSECFLRRAMCMEHKYIDILHYGTCNTDRALCPEATEIITLPKGYRSCKSEDHCPVSSVCHYEHCCFNHSVSRDCSRTEFGCCSDGVTHALGSRNQGCPEVCTCNPFGAYGNRCDPFNQCVCRRGVTGKQCDRCTHGYWNFLRMTAVPEQTALGCQECKCNVNGSQRADCDQTNGQCLCKEGVFGEKCNLCPANLVLSPEGCVTEAQLAAQQYFQSCDRVKCQFGGATCVQRGVYASCECPVACPDHVEGGGGGGRVVCGSDGNSYRNECSMVVEACAQGNNITVKSYGECATDAAAVMEASEPTTQSDSIIRLNECDLHPCHHGGECMVTATGHRCICPIGFGGQDCDDLLSVKIPKFAAMSYVEFPQLVGYQNLTLELSVKPSTESGLILYIGPDRVDYTSEFLSLALDGGILELRYSLEGDQGLVQTALALTQDSWHRIVMKHEDRNLALMVDYDQRLQSGMILRSTTQVSADRVRLLHNIRVGGLPANCRQSVLKFLGLEEGFSGCITNFRVNRVSIDMSYPDSGEMLAGAGVASCDYNPCKSRPCQNGGTCIVEDSYNYHCMCDLGFDGQHCEFVDNPCLDQPCEAGGKCEVVSNTEYLCHCPLGTRGLNCEKEIRIGEEEVFQPSFNMDSYLRTAQIVNAEQSLDIEMWFYTRKLEGILLFAGDYPSGDFILLMLKDHRAEFHIDSGMGASTVRAEEKLAPHTWNKVTVRRNGMTTEIALNDGPVHSTLALGGLMTLNLGTPLYVGGYPDISYFQKTGVRNGFKGVVQRLEMNKQVLVGNRTVDELNRLFDLSSRVMMWDNHECYLANPCQARERCLPDMGGHICDCSSDECRAAAAAASLMPQSDMFLAVHFPGNQVLPFHNGKVGRLTSQQSNKMELSVRTTSSNGLILWSKEGSTKDYLAVSLWNGFLKVEVDLGAGAVESFSTKPVSDGKWHHVYIHRQSQLLNLQVDSEANIRSYFPAGASKLDTDGVMWVGGHPFLSSEHNLPVNLHTSFVGCISYLKLEDQYIDFATDLLIQQALQYCDD